MEEEEELEIKFLDQEEYYNSTLNTEKLGILAARWPQDFEETEKKWLKKLEKTHETLVNSRVFCKRIVLEHMKTLSFSGIDAYCNRRDKKLEVLAMKQNKESFNLAMILRKYGEFKDQENFVYFINTVLGWNALEKMPLNLNKHLTTLHMRITDLHLSHHNYLQGIEHQLGKCELLRLFRNAKMTKHPKNVRYIQSVHFDFAQTAQSTMLALQAILEDWNTKIQMEKIVQITHANTLQLRAVKMKTDSLTVINEALICAIALQKEVDIEELEEMDTILSSKTKSREAKQMWGYWKTMSKMMRNRNNVQGCLIHAQRLEEEAEMAREECAVMVEMACKARAKCENQEERILEVITETIQRHPSLGPRMIQLAQDCNVGYETPQLLQTLQDTNKLHPSEPIWLTIIEKQIAGIGKYGSIEKTLKTSLKVMFEFLDYDSNRFEGKAWKLLKKALECTEPSFVAAEWKDRKTWWIKYQKTPCRNGRRMKRKAERVKEEVLQALENYIC